MLKIAITGGAGSGKSTVARMFQDLGAQALDADAAARAAVAVGTPGWEELRRAFGEEYFRTDGSLDRAKMARHVFGDSEARRRLEAIIHPRVAAEIARQLDALAHGGAPLALVEVPLLYEAGLEGAYDRVIVVYLDEAGQVRRLAARDHRSPAEIQGLLRAQWPLKEKRKRADYVIDNCGDLSQTREQVLVIWRELLQICQNSS